MDLLNRLYALFENFSCALNLISHNQKAGIIIPRAEVTYGALLEDLHPFDFSIKQLPWGQHTFLVETKEPGRLLVVGVVGPRPIPLEEILFENGIRLEYDLASLENDLSPEQLNAYS